RARWGGGRACGPRSRSAPDVVVAEARLETGERDPRLGPQALGDLRHGLPGEHAPADVLDERAVDAEQRVRDHPWLDVVRPGPGLVRDEGGERVGIAAEHLALA